MSIRDLMVRLCRAGPPVLGLFFGIICLSFSFDHILRVSLEWFNRLYTAFLKSLTFSRLFIPFLQLCSLMSDLYHFRGRYQGLPACHIPG